MKAPDSLGTGILSALYGAVRALQLYPAENEVVTRALHEVREQADRILDREGAGNDQYFLQAAVLLRSENHPCQAWIYWQTRHLFTTGGQLSCGLYRTQFLQ